MNVAKIDKGILPAPWTGRSTIEEISDEFEGHVMRLTQSEEKLIQKSCDELWRGAECKLILFRILAMKTDPHGRKHRTSREEESFDFRESAARRLVSAELRRSFPDSVTVPSSDVSCWSDVSDESQPKAHSMYKPLDNRVRRVVLELLRKRKLVFLGASWPVWTLNLVGVKEVQAVGKLGVMKSRISVNNSEVLGETVLRKSGAIVWNILAHELKALVECRSAEEEDVEDMEMPGGELRDGSGIEEQEPMTDGEQRDRSVAEHAGHSKRDLERLKEAQTRFVQV